MRRLTSLLLTAQLCAATRHGFSIHHDLLAYPQVRSLPPFQDPAADGA